MALQSPAHEPIKKLESKSFPRPFSMPTQQCHDNTIGCDSRFRSNLTLADANPPGSRVNNTPFRHQVDSQECLQPPDTAPCHSVLKTRINSQLVLSTSESLATVAMTVPTRATIAVQLNLANGSHIARSHTSAFRRGGLASQCNRITSQHHTTKHEIKVHKMYKI